MSAPPQVTANPRWTRWVLLAAGAYNIAWAIWVLMEPSAMFRFAGMEAPLYPELWQCIGMMVGVFGLGYVVAASDAARHWPIVLVGLLGKLLGPIGFVAGALQGTFTWMWGLTIITNDLIWWIPFAMLLYHAARVGSQPKLDRRLDFDEALDSVASHRGATLRQISGDRPVLVVFLRHSGCIFCREALSELQATRDRIDGTGARLAIVHMSSVMEGTQLLARYGLDDVHRFSDPDCKLYRAFGLNRGNFRQLFGPDVIWRGVVANLTAHHGLGPVHGDGFQLPGAFVLYRGEIVGEYQAQTAADHPDYTDMVCTASVALSEAVGQIPAVNR